ncbi:YraN family protein [Polaromonas sp. CG_9.5]|uniref:YraN family protein n=1 Tax=Polaromonas sp. CG_9.5 TaxID=3071705 RepID=UPI003FA3C548
MAVPPKSVAGSATTWPKKVTTKSQGDAAESAARAHLVRAGLRWVESNYRTPGRGGGEIDLIMRTPDGTLVFVEVRQRTKASHGGAGASISSAKQRRIIFAARHYLMRFSSLPPCRFDVVLVNGALSEGSQPPASIEWLTAAFDAS